MKTLKYVVAVVLTDQKNNFLVVKRPDNDPDLGGHWGFPAATLFSGELPEYGARRICREKLGCDCKTRRLLGIMFQKRNNYDLFLMDIEAEILPETKADVSSVSTQSGKTMYVAQKWTDDPNEVMISAKMGSCCSSIFLTDRGLLDKESWVDSLEGSDLVG